MRIKFISLNIWVGGRLMPAALEFLRREDADIVVLQEVYNGHDENFEPQFKTMEVLADKLPYKHFVFAPAFIDTHDDLNIEMGNAVLSKFPIVAHKAIFFDIPFGRSQSTAELAEKQPRMMLRAQIETPTTPLNIYSVHGIWGAHGNDTPRRFKMIETVLQEIQGKQKVIVAGDFNFQPHTKAIKNLESRLTNVFKDELTTTFNLKHKTNGGFATAVVDLMFVSREISVVEKRCPNVDISDHLSLVATLEIY